MYLLRASQSAMIIGEHISFGMPRMVTFPTKARSFDMIAVIALTIRSYDAIPTFIEIINGASIRYLKITASAFWALFISFPMFLHIQRFLSPF